MSKPRRVPLEEPANDGVAIGGPAVLALSLGLVLYSSTVHLLPGFNLLYAPLGVITTAVLVLLGHNIGLTASDVGLDRRAVGAGLRLGISVAGVVAFGLVVAVATPPLHPLFADERVADFGVGLVAYRSLIRIPLGTALLEEFAFRGLLFGAWQSWMGTRAALVGSSAVFGLWHIRPAIDLGNANGLSSSAIGQSGVVIAAVLLTAAAGAFLGMLRLRSNSLVAPFVAHAAVNSLSLVAAAVVAAAN